MSYIKAGEVLPEQLIQQIQQYVDGAYIYIPRRPGGRLPWGQKTDYRAELTQRNQQIRSDYARGNRVAELSRNYHLSEKSIRRILHEE